MKVTFYGSIALAAIAADNARATFTYADEFAGEDLAQNETGLANEAEAAEDWETNALASLETEAFSNSEGELDAWSDADSDSDADLDSVSDNMSDLDEDENNELCEVGA